jgi:hypothetical protein
MGIQAGVISDTDVHRRDHARSATPTPEHDGNGHSAGVACRLTAMQPLAQRSR